MRKVLVFFSGSEPPSYRRRRGIFVCLLAVSSLALAVPLHVPFSTGPMLVFGLPVSMVWVILWMFVVFGSVLWLFRRDSQTDDR